MKTQVSSIENFQELVATDTELQNKLKSDPVGTIKQFSSVRDSDVWIYRVVVTSLGLAVLAIIAGIVILMIRMQGLEDKNVPTVLTALGSAAIGALAGLLAPSPRQG